MTEENQSATPEVNTEQNYNAAAFDYIEANGLMESDGTEQGQSNEADQNESEAAAEDAPDNVQEAQSEEETGEVEASNEVETEEGDVEEPELYEFEVNGKAYNYTLDELKDAATAGLTFQSEKEILQNEVAQTLQEVEQYVGQHQENLARLETIDAAFEQLRVQDPALAEEFELALKQIAPQVNNPKVKALEQKIQELEKRTESKSTELENQSIQKEWSKGLDEVKKSYEPLLKQLGIKADWDGRVQNAWINSGNGTVEEALFAVHGTQIHKLSNSKKTVASVTKKAKSASAKPTAGKAKASAGQTKVDTKNLSYREIEERIAAGNFDF